LGMSKEEMNIFQSVGVKNLESENDDSSY